MALVRHTTYTKLADDSPVRIKKWSAVKLITLMREITDLLKSLPPDINLTNITPSDMGKLVPLIPTLGEKIFNSIVRLVRESVDPPITKNEEILEWDLEDIVGALQKVIELNWTDELRKNLSSLGTRVGLVARSGKDAKIVQMPEPTLPTSS